MGVRPTCNQHLVRTGAVVKPENTRKPAADLSCVLSSPPFPSFKHTSTNACRSRWRLLWHRTPSALWWQTSSGLAAQSRCWMRCTITCRVFVVAAAVKRLMEAVALWARSRRRRSGRRIWREAARLASRATCLRVGARPCVSGWLF